jgi:hypothetical protein
MTEQVEPADPAAEVADSMNRLARALACENAALRERNRRALAALQEEKRAAASGYQLAWKRFAEGRPDGPIPDPQGRELRAAAERLLALMNENQRRLRVAIEATRRLVEAIAAAAQVQTPAADTYVSTGRTGDAACRRSTPQALSYNRSL